VEQPEILFVNNAMVCVHKISASAPVTAFRKLLGSLLFAAGTALAVCCAGNSFALADDDADGDADAAETPKDAAVAGKAKRDNLISNSPFRKPRPNAPRLQTFEIRGFCGSGDNLEVSITNPATRECHWVKVRDPEAKWFVESADPVARTAVIKINDVSLDIEMAKPSEMPTPIRPAGGAGFAVPPRAPNIISMPSAGAQTRAQTTPAVTPANSRAGGATGGASRSGGAGTRGSGSGRSSSGSRR